MTNSHKCLYCKLYRLRTPLRYQTKVGYQSLRVIFNFLSEKSIARFILKCSLGYLSKKLSTMIYHKPLRIFNSDFFLISCEFLRKTRPN